MNKNHHNRKVLSVISVFLLFTATPAMALAPINIPEPSLLSLIGVGATAFVLARIIKRRK